MWGYKESKRSIKKYEKQKTKIFLKTQRMAIKNLNVFEM